MNDFLNALGPDEKLWELQSLAEDHDIIITEIMMPKPKYLALTKALGASAHYVDSTLFFRGPYGLIKVLQNENKK